MRRRARRRYLGLMHLRWRAAGAPRHYGRANQTLLTLLYLAMPAVLALGALWLLGAPASQPELPDARAATVLLLVPILGLWLLRRH
jgi:hypothetical protein